MNEGMQENYFSKKISELRKMAGLTQEQLAEQMGITYQAVSKWENGIACPDIMLLPKLADVFKIQIDEFFREKNDEVNQTENLNIEMPNMDNIIINELPWQDDGKMHVVVYNGHRLMKHAEGNVQEIVFKYEGAATEVISQLSVTCNDVSGNVTAGDAVTCGHVSGDVEAGDSVKCGNVGGSVEAGDGVQANDVFGNIDAGDSVTCRDVTGNVEAGDNVNANHITGKVKADRVKCTQMNA